MLILIKGYLSGYHCIIADANVGQSGRCSWLYPVGHDVIRRLDVMEYHGNWAMMFKATVRSPTLWLNGI